MSEQPPSAPSTSSVDVVSESERERWQRVSDIVADALEIADPARRRAFVEAACGDDSALNAEVGQFLRLADSDAHTLERTQVAQQVRDALAQGLGSDGADKPEVAWIGRRLGAWEIVAEIARGGMGAVYKAVRADDAYQQDVAIKLIRDGRERPDVIERFVAERQILASLDHPNIARLLDGGSTAEGLPYFVMEYVDGEPITQYAQARALPLGQRLALFEAVCAAVQFAHQRLVVHRDLKPGNILVTKDGVVKLLDFGIAKLVEADTGTALVTQQVMTPAYASPEQVRGEAVTTATDIYALGVVLYELLTGTSPYRARSTQPLDLAREICERNPDVPSSALTPTLVSGGATPALPSAALRRLRNGVRGDLDNIVLMALRKEPERRYASAEQLADDVRRYRARLPVRARADTFGYRTSRFVSRNRWAVSFAALAVVGLLGGIAATAWQAREARLAQARAERHFADVRTLVNGFIFKFFDQLQEIPGTRAVQKEMVDTGAEYLSALAKDSASDPALALEAAKGFINLAKVQSRDLADAKSQAALLQRALALIGQAAANGADAMQRIRLELAARTELAAVLVNAGDAREAGVQRAAAISLARTAVTFAANESMQLARADGLIEAARLGAVDVPSAERWSLAQEALAIHRELAQRRLAADLHAEVEGKRAITTLYAATVASEHAPPEIAKATARQLGDEAVRAFEALNLARPGQVGNLANLAFATSMAAELAREAGDLNGARNGFRRAREHAQALARLEPNLAQAKLNSVAAAMAEIEMELSARSDPTALYTLVQATLAEAATLPGSLAAERQGVAVRVGMAALSAEVKLRLCASPAAPTGGECAQMIAEAVEGFREANRLLPQIEDMIQRDNGEMLQLLKTGVQRAEAALASLPRKSGNDKR